MTALVPLATAAGAEQATLLHNLQFQTVGVMVVMTSLGGLALVVAILAALMAPAHKPARADAPAPGPVSAGEIPPEVRAVIAAAVHVALRSPHRIVNVQPATNPLLQAWSMEGRRQIFQSHSFRR